MQGNPQTDNAIDLRWQGQLYRLLRVRTSTGANRFEDLGSGLVWISIQSKAMLLNSKLGEPVANECKARGNGSRPVRNDASGAAAQRSSTKRLQYKF